VIQKNTIANKQKKTENKNNWRSKNNT
jgi:hypothetical protein